MIWHSDWYSSIKICRPSLSIYDSQGIFPLNLQRTDVSLSQLNFFDDLSEEIAKDFIAYFLVHSPSTISCESIRRQLTKIKNYKGVTYSDLHNWFPFLITNAGIAFYDVGVVQKLNISRLICVPSFPLASDDTFANIPNGTALVVFNYSQTYEPDLLRLIRLALMIGYAPGTTKALTGTKRRIILKKSTLKMALTPGKIAKHFREHTVEWEDADHVVISNNNDSFGLQDFINQAKDDKAQGKVKYIPLVEWHITNSVKPHFKSSPIYKMFSSNGWPLLIPFSIPARKEIFAEVYKTLSARIAYFEKNSSTTSENMKEIEKYETDNNI